MKLVQSGLVAVLVWAFVESIFVELRVRSFAWRAQRGARRVQFAIVSALISLFARVCLEGALAEPYLRFGLEQSRRQWGI